MIQFVHTAETAEDKILGRRQTAAGMKVTQSVTGAALKTVKRGRRALKSGQGEIAATVSKAAPLSGDAFAASRLYTVRTATGKTCLFNGFEISQMLTPAGKSALANGAATVTDGPYCITFQKDLSDKSL